MVCGLLKKWKQPVAFYFTGKQGVSALKLEDLLKSVIRACTNAGLHVLATVCDMGGSFVQTLKKLGVSKENPHFSLDGREIIALFDPPHLIKCTRNLLLKNDIYFKSEIDNVHVDGVAKWEVFERVYKRDKLAGTYRWLWKLTDAHMDPKFRKKMKVKLATQVLSHSMAAAVMKDVEIGLEDKEAAGSAHFAEFADRLFDSFNGVSDGPDKGKDLRCRLNASSPHHTFWNKAYAIVDNWKVFPKEGKGKKKKRSAFRPPSQDGWCITIRGLQLLWTNLQNLELSQQKPIRYLILRTVNQDALENAFCCIRSHCGSNANPTVSQFVAAFKTSVINGLVHQDLKQRGNCEEDNACILSNLQTLLFCDSDSSNTACNSSSEQVVDEESSRNLTEDQSIPGDWSSTAYVSGYIARRVLSSSSCSPCADALLTSPTYSTWTPSFSFKELNTEQPSLFYPSEGLCRSVGFSATLLENILDENVEMPNVKGFISNAIGKTVPFDWMVCLEHKSKIVQDIILSVCKIGIPWWCKKKNRSLKERNE